MCLYVKLRGRFFFKKAGIFSAPSQISTENFNRVAFAPHFSVAHDLLVSGQKCKVRNACDWKLHVCYLYTTILICSVICFAFLQICEPILEQFRTNFDVKLSGNMICSFQRKKS